MDSILVFSHGTHFLGPWKTEVRLKNLDMKEAEEAKASTADHIRT